MILFVVSDQKVEFDMMLEEQVQNKIDAAKQEGLEATRVVVEKWKHSEEYQWDILGVSAVSANKLLQGEFKTFDELYAAQLNDFYSFKIVQILYQEIKNQNRKGLSNFIIETIFINE